MDLIGGTSEYTEEVDPGSNQTPLPESLPDDDVTTTMELEPNKKPLNTLEGKDNNLGKRALDEIEFAKDVKSEDNDLSKVEPLLKKSCHEEVDHENCLTSAKIDTQKVKKEALKSDEVMHPVLTPEQQESVNRDFFEAIGANNIPKVIVLIEQGANVNAVDPGLDITLIKAAHKGYIEATGGRVFDVSPIFACHYNRTALICAAYRGYTEMTELLLKSGADVNAADRYGKTALIEAAYNGYNEITRLLLNSGANFNAADRYGTTALMEAVSKGHTEIAALLLESGSDVNAADNNGKTALMNAAERSAMWNHFKDRGHKLNEGNTALDMINLLLQSGAEVNAADNEGNTAFMYAVSRNNTKMIELLLQSGAEVNASNHNGRTALIEAASHGHTEITALLLGRGAEVNDADNEGKTALMEAVSYWHSEITELLLKSGAEVNAADNEGKTALMKAVSEGHTELAKLLLESGADVNAAARNGKTALMEAAASKERAAMWNHFKPIGYNKLNEGNTALDMINLLLESGADVNAADSNGKTALMEAVSQGRTEVARLLLEKGAEVNASDHNRRTALMEAASKGHTEMMRIILEKDAYVSDGDVLNCFVELFNQEPNFIIEIRELTKENIDKPPESLPKEVKAIALLIAYGPDVNFDAILADPLADPWSNDQLSQIKYCAKIHKEVHPSENSETGYVLK
ncbi:MAG: ankyrin repeat domain-containing protein [Rickettsiaceae bacterium]|nr:ankyrin repeat domain-containing protein [Rickettsiaceae bacterium]